jgi:hypothetical protein
MASIIGFASVKAPAPILQAVEWSTYTPKRIFEPIPARFVELKSGTTPTSTGLQSKRLSITSKTATAWLADELKMN